MIAYLGGTLYIDAGKPTPGGMATTVANLKDIVPTRLLHGSEGLAELIPHLRSRHGLRQAILPDVDFVFYSGAALSDHVLGAFDELSLAATGYRTPIMSAYGATETAPFALVANWPSETTGLAGVPLPGVALKLVPVAGQARSAAAAGPT